MLCLRLDMQTLHQAGFLALAALVAVNVYGDERDPDFAGLDASYKGEILPLLESKCLNCHDEENAKGELDLERIVDLATVRRDPGIWQQVVDQIEMGEMPPKDKAQFTAGQKRTLLGWVKNYLRAEAVANAGDPGPVLLRRLTNAEYAYSIRDLTGVTELNPTEGFPVDSAAGEGFTNTGAALVMSPALLEKYLAAGRNVARHAVLLPDGFRFSPKTSKRDWSDEIVGRIREFYYERLQVDGIDFGYRKQVGDVEPTDFSDGKVNLLPYVKALVMYRDQIAEEGNVESVARTAGINRNYLRHLAPLATNEPREQSLLLRQLGQMIRDAGADGKSEDELTAIVNWISEWQQALWKFQAVGHLGIIRNWQVPEKLDFGARVLRNKLSEGRTQVSLTALNADDEQGKVTWHSPRIVRSGMSPILLRDIKGAATVFPRYRSEILSRVEEMLNNAFAVRQTGFNKNPVDQQVKTFFAYLGIGGESAPQIEGYLSGEIRRAGGNEAINGWGIPGVRDLSLTANGSDQILRIPGEAPPHSILVHPRPERWVAASWQSPVTEEVDISMVVHHRHPTCGNGVEWRLEHQSRNQRRILRNGVTGLGGRAEPQPVKGFSVRKGDFLSLVVSAHKNDHSCDLSEINLQIVESETGADSQRWTLSEDCSTNILAGNPHSDRYHNPAVWHFHSGLDSDDQRETIPEGSMLEKWFATEDADDAAELAKAIQRLVAAPLEENAAAAADAVLHKQMTSANGALFSNTDFAALAKMATAEELQSSPFGLDEELFNGKGDLKMSVPSRLSFALPSGLWEEAEFVVTGEVTSGAAQLQVLNESNSFDNELQPGIPVSAAANEQTRHSISQAFEDFRQLFPAAMCYARIVPIDEVVTLVLYHREDEYLKRLMLSQAERQELDRLWEELRFVSEDAFRIVIALEQILEFATQDADPRRFYPLQEPIAAQEKALKEWKSAAVAKQLEALLGFAALAFRRPLGEDETTALKDLYRQLRSESISNDEAHRLLLARIFASPEFLYKKESIPNGEIASAQVSDWELATRLSYFLWSSAPDEQLRSLAAEGVLGHGDNLASEAQRMSRDHKIRRFASEFACQWLHVRGFDSFDEKSEQHFPDFAQLRSPMHEETVRFFTHLFQSDGSVLSILEADHTFLNGTLAEFYEINIEGDEWQKVEGMQAIGRGGILGMATTLARQSGASRTSPILRGNWVSETLLGEKLPKPPPGVPVLPSTIPSGLSERELIERHTSDVGCAKCHARIDPFGFALERFDAIGKRRETGNGGLPINTVTLLPDGTSIDGLQGLRNYLSETRRKAFVRQFCRKLLGYSLGRSTHLSDELLLEEMEISLRENEYRFSAALEPLLKSRQFRHIRGKIE